MYFLSLLVACGIGGLGWGIRYRSPRLGQALIIIGCLGCVGAIGWQVRTSLFPPGFKVPNRAHTVVGFFLASQTQREIAGQTGKVVLLLSSTLDRETAETYANSFRAPLLRGHPEWEVEVAKLDVQAKADTIPAETFRKAIESYPKALAFVSFSGVPTALETVFQASKPVPPLFVFDGGGTTNWLGALVQRRIRSVIVPRPDVDPAAMNGIAGMPGDIFGKLYYLATPETASQVAAKLAGTPATARN